MSLDTYTLTAEDAASLNALPQRDGHDLKEGDEFPAVILPKHEFDGGDVTHIHVFTPDGIHIFHNIRDERVGAGIRPGSQLPTEDQIAAFLQSRGLMVVPAKEAQPAPEAPEADKTGADE